MAELDAGRPWSEDVPIYCGVTREQLRPQPTGRVPWHRPLPKRRDHPPMPLWRKWRKRGRHGQGTNLIEMRTCGLTEHYGVYVGAVAQANRPLTHVWTGSGHPASLTYWA